MAPPDDIDPKVKDLLDAATVADLERWFKLPSYQELGDKGAVVEELDPEIVAVRERREKAIAAVDPALVEAHRKRVEPREDLLCFKSTIELCVDPSVALLDITMVERQISLAEPREVEISEELKDDLRDCTPQAMLRDLHRPELDFEKKFEIVDMAAEQRLDIVAMVADAMATNWKLPPLGGSPFREAREIMAELKAEHRQSWPALFMAHPLPNRRWVQDK
jgi:hypothetical protein